MSDRQYDVLIVGLGPVGAVLAGLLGLRGLSVLVIDRARDIYPLPRAAHFDHEIMRVFQMLGVTDQVLEHARKAGPYEFRTADGQLLMRARTGDEPSVSGWAYSYMFNQPGLERALRDRLDHMKNVELRLGCEFRSLEQTASGVTVLVSKDDEPENRLSAQYVVGCDGAWSPVREHLGIRLEDLKFDEPWLVVDTIPKDPSLLPDANLQICDPARPTTCVGMGPGRRRWEFMMLPGETAETVLEDSFITSLLSRWDMELKIERKAVYRFHGLVAERWREGRVLIAGDAAHQTPPFAGQGMCSGIRDAANLAWKLEAILKGLADPGLLETYQIERDGNVREYIRLAIDMGKVVCTLDQEVAAQRDRDMIARREAGEQPIKPVTTAGFEKGVMVTPDRHAGHIFPQFLADVGGDERRLDDCLGPSAWLISRTPPPGLSIPGLHEVCIDDAALQPFRAKLLDWFDGNAVEAVLVRPDRYVFGTGSPQFLKAEWSKALTRPADANPEQSVESTSNDTQAGARDD